MIREWVLKHADGRFYSFADQSTYDGPQFCRDVRDAKRMTYRGACNVRARLLNPKWHGEEFEVVRPPQAP